MPRDCFGPNCRHVRLQCCGPAHANHVGPQRANKGLACSASSNNSTARQHATVLLRFCPGTILKVLLLETHDYDDQPSGILQFN
eukprot:5072820-Amphidinium_carterae.1